MARRSGRCRSTALDLYLPFVRDTLAQYPRLRATRLHEVLRQHGYPGSAVQVGRAVRYPRPAPPRAAYLRLATLPGEVAQVDWSSFGAIRIGRGTRPLSAFALVLRDSRAIHAVLTFHQTLERRFKRARIGRFKPIADFEWDWPKEIDRALVERLLTLALLPEAENFVVVGARASARL